MGGMLLAVFFFASNLLPPVMLLPGVPVTLQTAVIVLMGGLLGLRAGLLNYLALLAATFVGLPMMSSFHAGPGAFATPTAGYIFGWVFVVAAAGWCSDQFVLPAPNACRLRYVARMTLATAGGVLLDYAVGIAWLMVYNRLPAASFPSLYVAGLVFLPFDAVKCALCACICCTPALAVARRRARRPA